MQLISKHLLSDRLKIGGLTVCALVTLLLSACANGMPGELEEMYSISFTKSNELPVSYLDYKVIAGNRILYAWGPYMVKNGLASGGGGYGGFSPKPTEIYVKWRVNETSEVHEAHVPFSALYEKSLKKRSIRILPIQDELGVFVISRPLKHGNCPPDWPRSVQNWDRKSPSGWMTAVYCDNAIEQIYPIKKIIFPEENHE